MTPITESLIEEAFKREDLTTVAKKIADDIFNNKYELLNFVESLGFALNSANVDSRVNGIRLLSSTLDKLPGDFMDVTQLEFLTDFYADRMKDHHNVIPPVIDGVNALIYMKKFPKKRVVKLLQSFFLNINCQSQTRNDREKIFKIFKIITENFSCEVKKMGGDFIYGMVNSIDGERDPRNLNFIFSFMPDLIQKFTLLHLYEEMFEVFACYFPIDFNPSISDPEFINRDILASKLANCLVATEIFVKWTVALALEKLQSDSVIAKLDSLELINMSAQHFSVKSLKPHFDEIWSVLKPEIFPGADNLDVVTAGLKALHSILERSKMEPNISYSYQTIILGTILPHLCDVNQRLFNPSSEIALVCTTSDPQFASQKILEAFLFKLKSESVPDEQKIIIYKIISKIFKIVLLQNMEKQDYDVYSYVHEELIKSLRCEKTESSPEVIRAALNCLNESVSVINESNRLVIYRLVLQILTHGVFDIDMKAFLERLAIFYSFELQSQCINICIRDFPFFTSFVKNKIYNNFLPLVRHVDLRNSIINLILSNILQNDLIETSHLAFIALNNLLKSESYAIVKEIQNTYSLIEKIINLGQNSKLNISVLEQCSTTLSLIIKHLPISEQKYFVIKYLTKLNLHLNSDLILANGLYRFIHKDIYLNGYLKNIVNDLIKLLLESNIQSKLVAQHLLSSVVNKMEYNEQNKVIIKELLEKLENEINKENSNAVEILAWISKGLIVRGCDFVPDITETICKLLDKPSLSVPASTTFEVICTDYPEVHLPVVKLLFKQKFFQVVIEKIWDKLESNSDNHLNAFIYVLKSTPHAVIKMNIEKVGPILFKCLETNKTLTMHISLQICENFIKHQDAYFRDYLNFIIPMCLKLSQYIDSMEVRISSLHLLNDISKYSTFLIMPFKMDVVFELTAALDDTKRLVRNSAVTARNAWFLIGAQNDK